MGRSRSEKAILRSQTLPSSPTRSFSSSSSSDFEFNISSSPHNPNNSSAADDLFYKGKLLPLHLSPRLSMVRTLLLASSTSSSNSTTTTSRDSSGSSSSSDLLNFSDYSFNCDSSRPSSSSVTELDDELLKRPLNSEPTTIKKNTKYFSLSKISSVFKKNTAEPISDNSSGSVASGSVKRISFSARDVFKKYIKKVKPLYEKLSQSQKQKIDGSISSIGLLNRDRSNCNGSVKKDDVNNTSLSFSGNLWFPKRKGVVSSCPSSMRTSPCHSGVLTNTGLPHPSRSYSSKDSSMEELQSAIQGAIAHCKNSMLQNRSGPLVIV